MRNTWYYELKIKASFIQILVQRRHLELAGMLSFFLNHHVGHQNPLPHFGHLAGGLFGVCGFLICHLYPQWGHVISLLPEPPTNIIAKSNNDNVMKNVGLMRNITYIAMIANSAFPSVFNVDLFK